METTNTYAEQQQMFLEEMGVESYLKPTFDIQTIRECFDMVLEELKELSQEVIKCEDMEESGDFSDKEITLANITAELVDLVYVSVQMANRLGLPFDGMFEAIHEANLSKKTKGKVRKSPEGKILKPKGWQPVDKLAILNWGEETYGASRDTLGNEPFDQQILTQTINRLEN
jgi:hypothetical protein